jgi:thioredoxin-like negative regulator of GroEL
LLLRYHNAKELRKAVGVLDALTQSYPAKPELVIRLARIHELNGDQEKAIAVLDALGDAQLGAGDKVAAAATIRRIIAMNPPRIADYQNLLAHLSE